MTRFRTEFQMLRFLLLAGSVLGAAACTIEDESLGNDRWSDTETGIQIDQLAICEDACRSLYVCYKGNLDAGQCVNSCLNDAGQADAAMCDITAACIAFFAPDGSVCGGEVTCPALLETQTGSACNYEAQCDSARGDCFSNDTTTFSPND
jgi:hypothetical protein